MNDHGKDTLKEIVHQTKILRLLSPGNHINLWQRSFWELQMADYFIEDDDIMVTASYLIAHYRNLLQVNSHGYIDTACLMTIHTPDAFNHFLDVVEQTKLQQRNCRFDVIDISDAWANLYEFAHLIVGRSDQLGTLSTIEQLTKRKLSEADGHPCDITCRWYAFLPISPIEKARHTIVNRFRKFNQTHEQSVSVKEVEIQIRALSHFAVPFSGTATMAHHNALFSGLMPIELACHKK